MFYNCAVLEETLINHSLKEKVVLKIIKTCQHHTSQLDGTKYMLQLADITNPPKDIFVL